MPNALAFLLLAVTPVLAAMAFRALRPGQALIWVLLVAYLFLPEPPAAFDMPLVPPLDKHNIPALAVFVILLWRGDVQGPLLPQSALGKALVGVFVFSPLVTALTNPEGIFFGQVGLPGLQIKDGLALVLQQFLLVLPFLMARHWLGTAEAQRQLLAAFAGAGLVYSLLMLLEIRLSPQLNLWVYGYFQHYFEQSIRDGGYRPVVFLYHGLWVAFYCLMAVMAALALWRFDGQGRVKWMLAAGWLAAVLVLAKSLGALIFLALAVPVLVLLSSRWQIWIALMIGVAALAYPVLKGMDAIPTEAVLNVIAQIDPERANSLAFRFENEATLKDRAMEKPIFGWGSWGRNHILHPVTGNIMTVTDGRWIILIGIYGWVGFLAEFGLLLLPLLLIGREALARPEAVSPLAGPLALILGLNMFDMLPNATLTPLTWLVAGALLGYAEALRRERLKIRQRGTGLTWQSIL